MALDRPATLSVYTPTRGYDGSNMQGEPVNRQGLSVFRRSLRLGV